MKTEEASPLNTAMKWRSSKAHLWSVQNERKVQLSLHLCLSDLHPLLSALFCILTLAAHWLPEIFVIGVNKILGSRYIIRRPHYFSWKHSEKKKITRRSDGRRARRGEEAAASRRRRGRIQMKNILIKRNDEDEETAQKALLTSLCGLRRHSAMCGRNSSSPYQPLAINISKKQRKKTWHKAGWLPEEAVEVEVVLKLSTISLKSVTITIIHDNLFYSVAEKLWKQLNGHMTENTSYEEREMKTQCLFLKLES